jgi:hypothetical protein
VRISETGFTGDGDTMTRGVSDSTGSFTFLVRWLKAWLEHGIELGVVLDAHPDRVTA